ncbi:MAG: TonB-dependent receptor [Flavobacteriaceae bacterium]|nr:MAG: TonB-dependent receptor [Flavobacteriaceae bacterium]
MKKDFLMKVNCIFLLLSVFLSTNYALGQDREHELSFKIIDNFTGRPLQNADVFIQPCDCGGISDSDGMFSIRLPENNYQIIISFIGFGEDVKRITLDKDLTINVSLSQQEEQLSEVIVRAKNRIDDIESPQMGALQLSTQELKKLPAAIGEYDVLKGMTLVAGVNNAGEVSNGLSVRGGSLDQNLLLYDYAPVFNPTHLFGLFSVFTPDALSSVELYRANIPARYGGRITSVLDIKVKNPYVDKFKLSGGVGLVSSRLTIETPIIEDKLMIIAGGRAGVTDFLLPIVSKRLKNTKARFYDATIKLLYLPTDNDQISFTGFFSKDFYQLDLISKIDNINAENNQYDFRTLNGTLNWLHSINESSRLRTILVGSDYNPKTIFPEVDSDNDIEFESRINYLSLISEYSKNINEKLDYYVGIQANRYEISPGSLDPGTGNSILPVSLTSETGYELSGYTNINWNPTESLSLSAGMRYTNFSFVGPYTLAQFDATGEAVIDTQVFDKGEKVSSYSGLEPRLGINLKLNETTSIKASYAKVNQYLQNVYNSTTPLPTSRWKLSDLNFKPQTSNTYGFGIYKILGDDSYEIGLEGYYRDTENVLAYKPGADFFLEEYLERDVVQGFGESYGVELSLKKSRGKMNGWLNYTWSKSLLRSQSGNLVDRINNNNWYPSDFDRPHVLNGTVNFEGDKYNTVSLSFTGQSGRPYTIPSGYFEVENKNVPIYLERNNSRLPIYHRLDFSWTIKYAKKVDKRWLGDWTFTVYNVYGRRNPFNSYYTQRNGDENSEIFLGSPLGSYELSILNSPLFALTYNFVFQ